MRQSLQECWLNTLLEGHETGVFISIHFLNSGNSREESPSTNDHKDPVYQENKELDTVCWNLSKKTVQEHRNHPSCGT